MADAWETLRSLSEIQTASASLLSRPALAIASLRRVQEIFSRVPDPVPVLLVLRLLAGAYAHNGSAHDEANVRLQLLERTVQMKETPAQDLITAQALFSYAVLGDAFTSGEGRALRERLRSFLTATEDPRLRGNALVLHALSSGKPPDAVRADLDAARQLLSSPSAAGSDAALSAYLDRLLSPGDVQLLLGDHHTYVERNPAAAKRHYEAAVAFYEALPSPALPLVKGGAQLPLAYALSAVSRTSEAVTATERHLGEQHPSLATALRFAAEQQQREGDAITAEGLFRAAIGRLEKDSGKSVERQAELMDSRWRYAALLDQLSWNGRSRKAEGDRLRSEVEAMAAQQPPLLPTLDALRTGRRSPMPAWLVERFSL